MEQPCEVEERVWGGGGGGGGGEEEEWVVEVAE